MSDLTEPMRELLAMMARQPDRSIHRYPGGFWNAKGMADGWGAAAYGTSTVEAVVRRGMAKYTEHREGRSGLFPIRATLV